MSIFTRAPRARVPRTGFNLNETVKFTGSIGKLYPIYCRQMLPGDIFKISVDSFLKFSPLNNPLFHEVFYKTRWFFCPHRLIDENFEETITGGEDGLSADKAFPRWNPSKSGKGLKTLTSDVVKPDSLWDYFGFPMLVSDTTHCGSLDDSTTFDDDCMPLSYPLRAYNRIYNTWFRDEERESEIVENETESGYNSDILRVNYRNDYFTSAALDEQKGIPPALPLTGTLPVSFSNKDVVFAGSASNNGIDGSYNKLSAVNYGEKLTASNSASAGNNGITGAVTNIAGSVNMGSAGTFTIKDLRLTSAIQRWMEMNEEAGSRYGEYLRSMYGVFPRDERLQRPEYIGGTVTLVNASVVIQTSSAVSGSPQGNETGRLSAFNRAYVGTYKAYEFGTLMCLAYVVPKATYMAQGFPQEWMHLSRYEFPNPLFAHVGNVPVLNSELYAKGHKASGGNKGDDTIFGWQGKDDAYRVGHDRAVSGFRTATYQSWTMDRVFSDYPENNHDFLKCDPDLTNVFAVPTAEHFASYTGFSITAIRPLPRYPMPILQ